MEQDLLNCSICPKQPSFSDTSHLLTHVSSKGHLSEWHKLQVRSFQDIAAGVALTNYNQWCQQHDIDRLLSERMQMKEEKQARKRNTASIKPVPVQQAIPIDHALLEPLQTSKRPAKLKSQTQTQKRGGRGKQRKADEYESDSDFSPVKRSRRKTQRPPLYSSPKLPEIPEGAYSPLDDCPAENDPTIPSQVLATPEHIKLKGIVWPGMALFDAATQEMQQKRNQKKDASVLRRMERLARLVEPTEVVYSPNGDSILKARHIDDLEDASSLVEGETPIPKPRQHQPRKRKPLAEKDSNTSLIKRKAKLTGPKNYADLTFAHGLPPLPHLPSSTPGEPYGITSRFFPTEEDGDIKPFVETLVPRKRPPPHFEIFTEGSPRHQPQASAVNGMRNPLQPRGYSNIGFPSLPKVSAPWLQPQYQSALQYTDPYTVYRPMARQYQAFYEPNIAHENIPPMDEPTFAFRASAANPLSWKSPVRPLLAPGLSPNASPLCNLFSLFHGGSPGDDPFVSTKNPLAGALDQVGEEENSEKESEFSSTPDTASSNLAEA